MSFWNIKGSPVVKTLVAFFSRKASASVPVRTHSAAPAVGMRPGKLEVVQNVVPKRLKDTRRILGRMIAIKTALNDTRDRTQEWYDQYSRRYSQLRGQLADLGYDVRNVNSVADMEALLAQVKREDPNG